jgi:glucosamine-6-phosphate isomerase
MNLLRFDSPAAWAAGVATMWRDRLHTSPTLSMCLPTGMTPNPIYAEMVKSVRAGHASFARSSVWALDEFGGLAPDDPGRLTNMLLTHLVNHVDLPKPSLHVLDPAAPDLGAECRRFDAESGGRFDLVLLGIGLNGHIGMNEPGSAVDSATRRVDLHPMTIASASRYFTHRTLPRWGITVGVGPIMASREVWLLANGWSKAEIVRRTLDDAIDESLPASLLRRHPNCSFFLDPEAAASIR